MTTSRFQAHVHPETYQSTDPLDWRRVQLHTRRADCTLTDCTFQDHYPEAQVQYVTAARDLRGEIAAVKRAERKAVAAPAPEPTPEPTPETPKRKSVPNAERRNETTHPDGAAAVAGFPCPTCKARKGVLCTARSGERTKHVHAGRLARLDAAISKAVGS